MAIYSDLLFAVSGDPIDLRASIYKKNVLKRLRNIFFDLESNCNNRTCFIFLAFWK
jgi:hypothetical protein